MISEFEEKDFISNGFKTLISESRKSGHTMWAATLEHWSPIAAYRLSKSAAIGGNPSWRNIFYELPVTKTFIFGEHSLPDEDLDRIKHQGIHIEIVKMAGHSMAWENPAGLAQAIAYSINGV